MRKKRSIVILVVLLVAAGTVVGYIAMSKRNPGEEPNGDLSGPDPVMGPGYTFDPFIVNVAESGSRRYLKCTITVEFDGNAGVTEMAGKVPLVRDVVIDILSSKTMEDLEPGVPRDALRAELVSAIGSSMTKSKVTRVFFSEFAVQ